ncbi:MAG TPA: hypothetical protein P5514_16030 [Bacteroidales bacterium]|nr:hypothetical protein [Bacteroidales bacterium]HRX98454.1 hypothetical protein [Bacteroidales bacterium]
MNQSKEQAYEQIKQLIKWFTDNLVQKVDELNCGLYWLEEEDIEIIESTNSD